MDPKIKSNFASRILSAITALSSQNFPAVAKIILQHKYDIQLELRGQNLSGEPVGYTLDSNTAVYKDVAEFGVATDYFKNSFKKIIHDYKHCLKLAPQCERIFLMSTRDAGPKNYQRLNRIAAWRGQKIGKEIYVLDGKWMATYIIDEILEPMDINTLDLLAEYIAFIDQIKFEFGYSNNVPTLTKDNWARVEPIKDVLDLLDVHRYVQINGLSGMGKTYLALQVYHELKQQDSERMVIWIPGVAIEDSNALSSLRIERYAVPQNVLGLIKRFKCIVIIDSLEHNAASIIQRIEQELTPESHLIVTSQAAADVKSVYNIPQSDYELSRKILETGLSKKCPDKIFEQIMAAVGGHPFLLDQINILIKKEQVSWSKVMREVDNLTASTFDNQSFYNRLLSHHFKTSQYELGVLKWIDAKEIDESLLTTLIGKVGVKKLQDRNFFNANRNGSFVLHDIVFNSLVIIDIPIDVNAIEVKLSKNLKSLYFDFDPDYYRIIHAHRTLILRILEKNRRHDIFKYSYLVSVPLLDYDKSNFEHTLPEQLTRAFENFKKDDYFLIMSWIEQTEKEFRIIKSKDRDATKAFLLPKIKEIEDLLQAKNRLTRAVKLDITNHLGKFLRDSGQRESSIKVFESILKDEPDFWAAKFHLAKLYRKDNGTLAQQYLTQIIDAYRDEQQISSTIVLATFKEIRSHTQMDLLLQTFIDSFEQLLAQTMISRFDQPYEVLGALASRIQFGKPEVMIRLTRMLPIPAEDAIENNTLFDVGMIYINTGKAYQQLGQEEKAKEFFLQGTAYYDKLEEKDAFKLRGVAEAFILLSDGHRALENLNKIPSHKQDLWYNFTLAKTLKLLGKFTQAKDAIELTIKANTNPTHVSTFFRERGSIRFALTDQGFEDDYNHAIANCNDQKFTDIMKDELKSLGKKLLT